MRLISIVLFAMILLCVFAKDSQAGCGLFRGRARSTSASACAPAAVVGACVQAPAVVVTPPTVVVGACASAAVSACASTSTTTRIRTVFRGRLRAGACQ